MAGLFVKAKFNGKISTSFLEKKKMKCYIYISHGTFLFEK